MRNSIRVSALLLAGWKVTASAVERASDAPAEKSDPWVTQPSILEKPVMKCNSNHKRIRIAPSNDFRIFDGVIKGEHPSVFYKNHR